MAGAETEPHYSRQTLDMGERVMRLFGNTPPVRWAMRSDSPAYIRLNWFSLPDLDPESLHWADSVPGDPDAGAFPRSWHNAAVIGASRDAMLSLYAHDPEEGYYARDAVAYESEGVVRVGLNPDSPHIFGGTTDGSKMLTVAMRLGTGPLRATMLQYEPYAGRVWTPDEPVVLERSIPNVEIPERYPHTLLAG